MNSIEEKRNILNLEIRKVLGIIDLIDGKQNNYEDYITNSLDENGFLDQQIKLVKEANERLVNIFKDQTYIYQETPKNCEK